MKKILAICLSVLLICAAMPFAFATAAADPTIVVSEVEGKAGETVSVTVSMKNNPGITSTKVKVGYDASALELLEYAQGDFSASGYSWGNIAKNPFVINWCDMINPNNTAELLATLTFKIKDTAKGGEYALTLEYDNEGDIYNENWDTVIFGADEGAAVGVHMEGHIIAGSAEHPGQIVGQNVFACVSLNRFSMETTMMKIETSVE